MVTRVSHVFNAAQLDDAPTPIAAHQALPSVVPNMADEAILAEFVVAAGVRIVWGGTLAYIPATDTIRRPNTATVAI